MRFVVDECTGPAVADWLRSAGHEVFSVHHQARGASDEDVLKLAVAEDRILITNDKDFGDRIFRDHEPHKGVVFLRLNNERAANKVSVLQKLLALYADQLPARFVVVTETNVRIAGPV